MAASAAARRFLWSASYPLAFVLPGGRQTRRRILWAMPEA
jgi:hypothetical protein